MYFFQLLQYRFLVGIFYWFVVNGTSWLGDNYDSTLLYGALLEAQIFMKGEADVYKYYLERYNEAMTGLKVLSEGKNRQDTYRTEQVRLKVE